VVLAIKTNRDGLLEKQSTSAIRGGKEKTSGGKAKLNLARNRAVLRGDQKKERTKSGDRHKGKRGPQCLTAPTKKKRGEPSGERGHGSSLVQREKQRGKITSP